MDKILRYFLFFVFAVLVLSSCGKKKKGTDNNNNNNSTNCNLSMSTVVVNDTLYSVTKDTGYAANSTFYTEHQIDNTHGCSAEFEGSDYPAEGTYTITPIFIDVIPGSKKVYMQYFIGGTSYLAQSGTVTVAGSGADAIITVCKILYKDSFGNEKTVSFKTDSK